MVSSRFLSARSGLISCGFGLLSALVACGGQDAGDTGGTGATAGIVGVGSSAGLGSGPSASGAPGAAGSGFTSGGAGSTSSAGAPSVAGAASGGANGGTSCAGVTPWTSGTTATEVSHGGKRYSCKQKGWCSSTAGAYEPGVGFAWQDAWNDEGPCGSGGSAGSGSGGTTGSAGAGNGSAGAPNVGCALDAVLGENNFQAWYPARNGFYSYANLCKAIGKYPAFATTGDTTAKKREVAAFFANVARETGNLKFIDQISKDPANGNYWGRGPLQLTWNYNYESCGKAIGADLLGNPGLVSSDGAITWETALWFWMTNDGGTGKTPHTAIVGGSFGGTIKAINGTLECKGPNEGANERIAHYQTYTQALTVDPGPNLTCW